MVKREGTCKSCKFHGTGRDSDECNNKKSKNYKQFKDLFDTNCPDWVDYREEDKRDGRNNEECKTCSRYPCPRDCFNQHPGSIIALKKLMKIMGKDKRVRIISEKEVTD